MIRKQAEEIFKDGPKFDVGVDAQYYIAKGFLEGSAQLDEALDLLESVWNGCDADNEETVGKFLLKHGRKK